MPKKFKYYLLLIFAITYSYGEQYNGYKKLPNPTITRFDGYVNVSNLFDSDNIREYYWDREMRKDPIWLTPVNCDIGLRIGFRL